MSSSNTGKLAEVFTLFSSNSASSQDLGMVDAQSIEIEVTLNGREFTIKQSPGVLQSDRKGGTTGAALWRACLLFADWLGTAQNVMFTNGLLDSDSTVLELGSGISGLVPLTLRPRVKRMIATDQAYALNLLRENVAANLPSLKSKSSQHSNNLEALALDWETSDIPSFLRSNGLASGVDALLVCDCIFNYALIQPLVQTCVEVCEAKLEAHRIGDSQGALDQTVCMIVQQLRQPDVFEEWMRAFHAMFRVWRVRDDVLTDGLKEGDGYVVHIGILRQSSR